MFYKWHRKLKTWNFDRQISAIMETPPLRLTDAGWTIASMIMIRDVPMYILAIKAFYICWHCQRAVLRSVSRL